MKNWVNVFSWWWTGQRQSPPPSRPVESGEEMRARHWLGMFENYWANKRGWS